MAGSKAKSRSQKRDFRAGRSQEQAERKTRRKLSKANLSDDDDDDDGDKIVPPNDADQASELPKVDLNQIPVDVYVWTTSDDGGYLAGVPPKHTHLGQVDQASKVFEFIEQDEEISGPLQKIYNLTIAEQLDTVLGFTDHNGARHPVPLYRYTDPTRDGDVDDIGAHVTAWKNRVAAGELDHTPRCVGSLCGHTGQPHGVVIMQKIRTPYNMGFVKNTFENEKKFADAYMELVKRNEALEGDVARLKEESGL